MNDRFLKGRYRLKQLLGKGAFAEVYLAVDEEGNSYACKISENSELLMREAGFQRGIQHFLFPEYVDAWQKDGKGWLMMEYVQGETLERIVGQNGFFAAKQAAEIGRQLAEGLLYLHERQEPLLFRDIKPANVMLEKNGRVKLLDFGCVCRAGEKGSAAGTPGFGAPEQFQTGSRQGTAADVYGLGQTLAAMVGKTYDKKLREVIRRCTMQMPEERLPDMRYVKELLSVCCGKQRFSSAQKAVLQGRIVIRKNIWEYERKRT